MSKKITKNSNFEKVQNFRELVERYKKFGDNVAFKYKNDKKEIEEVTYSKYVEDIKALGTALLDLGLKRVALIGNNRYEWVTSYLGVATSGIIIVPLDKALTDKEIVKLVKRSGTEAIIYDGKYQSAVDELGADVKYKICMDEPKEGDVSYKDLLEKGRKAVAEGNNAYDNVEIDNEVMSIMLFTSGTTSEPKAVMLSQRNVCENITAYSGNFKIYPSDTLLSFLPIHHTFECSITFLYGTYCGATIAFCEGLKYIAQNLKEYKITIFVAVPLVLETMYKKIQKGIEESGKKELLDKMTKVSNVLLKCKIDIRRTLFKTVREKFDEDLRVVLYGAAAMDKETIIGYNNLGIELIQGYGLTETSPVVTAESSTKKRPGSVGIPLSNVEVKIDNPNEEGVGELLAKGPNIMLGYYENEEATKKAIDEEGWLHTGDYAYIDKDGYIFITGRHSDIIVLKNGKNIYPQELEFLINKLPYVDECMVYSRDKSKTDTMLCAKIVYNKDNIKEQFGDKLDDEYKQLIWNDVKEINKELPTYKHIKDISITDEPLEKTTTQKVKRYVEMKKIEKSN